MSNDIIKMLIEGKTEEVQKVQEVLKELNLKSIKVHDDYEKSESINAQTVTNNLANYYGKYVRYKAPNGCNVKWRILGSDGKNIYLIADDYVSKEYIPCGRKGSKIYVNGSDYEMSFENVIDDYEGSVDISKKLRILNSKYFEALKDSISNRLSDKVLAFMMDVDIWDGFAGEKTECAISGPTLELLLDSYNKLHPTQRIDYYSNSRGYMIRQNSNIERYYYLQNIFDDHDKKFCIQFDVHDKTFCIQDESKAYGTWIASPSAYSAGSVLRLNGSGFLFAGSYCLGHMGFRPLVSLKSDTTLKIVEDDEYEIQ